MVHIRLLNKINEGFLSLVKVKRVVTDLCCFSFHNKWSNQCQVGSLRIGFIWKLVSSSHQIMSRLLDGRLASKWCRKNTRVPSNVSETVEAKSLPWVTRIDQCTGIHDLLYNWVQSIVLNSNHCLVAVLVAGKRYCVFKSHKYKSRKKTQQVG